MERFGTERCRRLFGWTDAADPGRKGTELSRSVLGQIWLGRLIWRALGRLIWAHGGSQRGRSSSRIEQNRAMQGTWRQAACSGRVSARAPVPGAGSKHTGAAALVPLVRVEKRRLCLLRSSSSCGLMEKKQMTAARAPARNGAEPAGMGCRRVDLVALELAEAGGRWTRTAAPWGLGSLLEEKRE